MKTLFLGIAAVISLTIGAIAPAHAINISSATRSLANALPVHAAQFSKRAKPSSQLFCLQLGNDCHTGGENVVAYANRLRTVLASFSPLPVVSHDYAMITRTQLIKVGIPAGSMRLANVTRPDARHHSGLVVATSNGDFVLDTRQRTIVKRCASGYSFASLAEMRSFD